MAVHVLIIIYLGSAVELRKLYENQHFKLNIFKKVFREETQKNSSARRCQKFCEKISNCTKTTYFSENKIFEVSANIFALFKIWYSTKKICLKSMSRDKKV